ncbi:MAG TPA: Gfo/Idh/MocA family oxidoreductase [Dermatophilaceae bacterium]|nr:Gfo/Idh/MocA family oxidoreductase [Dermatophilaceae bacterium]
MVRMGLVGYGLAGAEFHAPLATAAGLELAAVVSSDPGRRQRASRHLRGVTLHDDLAGLLAAGGVDVIVLASPTGAHAGQAHAVIDAGVPVVVDKPLAVDAETALAVVDHAVQAGVPLTVFQNRRYDSEFATLTDVVRSRAVGAVHRLEMRWERWRPEPKLRWREQLPAEQGGGLLLDLQAHLVDGAVRLFGPVDSVFATVDARTTRSEDDTFLVCRHASGVVSHLTASSLSAAPGPRVRLLGNAAAYLSAQFPGEPVTLPDLADADADHCGWLYRGAQREPVRRVRSEQADFYRGLAAALAAHDRQAAMPVDPRDAVHVLAVLDAARESARGHRVVEVLAPGRPPSP